MLAEFRQAQERPKRWSEYSSSASEASPEEDVLEDRPRQQRGWWQKRRRRQMQLRNAIQRRSRCDWSRLLQALSHIATASPFVFIPLLRSRVVNVEATFDFAGALKEDFTPLQCQLLVNIFHDFFPRGIRVCHWWNMRNTVLFQPYQQPTLYVKTAERSPPIVILHKCWEAEFVVRRTGFYERRTIRSLTCCSRGGRD